MKGTTMSSGKHTLGMIGLALLYVAITPFVIIAKLLKM